jgi:hypothetical protein
MAQRRITQPPQDNTPDYLVKPKAQFESELDARIKLGEDMINRQIATQQDYSSCYQEYTFWNDYNEELLGRAFNKKENQYYKDYTYAPSMFMGISTIGGGNSRPLSIQEIAAKLRGDVSKYLERLKKIKGKLGLIDELPGLQLTQSSKGIDKQAEGLRNLSNIFSKFHRVAQHLRHRHADRDTLIIKDEYDVQDLLHSLLHLHFGDIRAEDYSPSYAGGNSRVDFTLKDEKIVVEVKMTNDHLKDKEIGNQLLIDIGRYRGHPDCEVLVVFVYDKLDNIRNKPGLIADLERMGDSNLKVRVFIEPK